MAENRGLLLAGIGLAAYAGYQLLQKPPAVTPPPPVLPPPPPGPVAGTAYQVTAPLGLIVRGGPGTGYARRGAIPYGTSVTIDCQTTGERIGNSAIWDRITGPIAGYVSDWWISTPGVGVYSPGLGVCPGGAVNPPPPPILPPTGGGKVPIADRKLLLAGMVISTGCSWNDAGYVVVPDQWAGSGLARVWIRDKFTWDTIGLPRSVIRVVTPGVLLSVRDAGTIWYGQVFRTGLRWQFSPSSSVGPFSGIQPALPPRVNSTAAGYCS